MNKMSVSEFLAPYITFAAVLYLISTVPHLGQFDQLALICISVPLINALYGNRPW
jgi:hypothetical protein